MVVDIQTIMLEENTIGQLNVRLPSVAPRVDCHFVWETMLRQIFGACIMFVLVPAHT